MTNLIKHLKTVHTHRKYVRKACFAVGLYWQGLVHDLSKYSLTESSIAKYYTGKKSPHQTCRDTIGYSPCWLHHYHTNKHHWEYWLDDDELGKFYGIKMPFKYVLESACDMLGASKAYNPDDWKPDMLLGYWVNKCKGRRIMHFESENLIEFFIYTLFEKGEDEFYKWFKVNGKKIEKAYNDGLFTNPNWKEIIE